MSHLQDTVFGILLFLVQFLCHSGLGLGRACGFAVEIRQSVQPLQTTLNNKPNLTPLLQWSLILVAFPKRRHRTLILTLGNPRYVWITKKDPRYCLAPVGSAWREAGEEVFYGLGELPSPADPGVRIVKTRNLAFKTFAWHWTARVEMLLSLPGFDVEAVYLSLKIGDCSFVS